MSLRAFCSAAMFACALSLALLPQSGMALDELYTVSVPLHRADPDASKNAYKAALELLLIRVTGTDDDEHLSQLAEIFVNPTRYVLRFRAGPDDTLLVSFDGNAIEQLLRQYHYTVWGADRPTTLVWLAVDWGEGEREIVAADDDRQSDDATRSIDRNRLLRERVEDTALRRGISMMFPLLDMEDRQNIGFSDIWGGFDDRLIEASRRYGTSSVLVGRVRVDSAQPNRWTYYLGDERLSWVGEPEDATNRVADALAEHLAIHGDAVLETYALTVKGVDSIVAYGRVTQLMRNLGVIEEFALQTVRGNNVEYSVSLYGGIERLGKALELSGMLQPTTMIDAGNFTNGPMTDPQRLYFDLIPAVPAGDPLGEVGRAGVAADSYRDSTETRAVE